MARRRKDKRKGKRWSYTAGSYPFTVRVFERTRGGVLYAATWDPTARNGRGGELKRSLEHRDREAAKSYADTQAGKLRGGMDDVRAPRPTLARIFGFYERHRTPDKSKKAQDEDRRQMEMWKRILGSDFDVSKFSIRQWDDFIRRRRSGAINGRGREVPNPKRKEPRSVGDRVVEKDLLFLQAVCGWACDFRDEKNRLLLDRDPTRGYEAPNERNPKRPLATHDRVDAIRKVYHQMTMSVDGKAVESYLPEIFEIVVGTGRRIRAVLHLRSEDLRLEPTKEAAHGAIVWPGQTDKMGKEWACPISADVRRALDSALRKRRHVGAGWLFPAPRDKTKPVCYEITRKWLRGTERMAELEPMERGVFHAYRRLWATSRKGLPDIDVMAAGGWSSPEALKRAYQHPDHATMFRVVTHGAELREAK